MIKVYKGLSFDTEALRGVTKKEFCEKFKKANRTLRPLTVEDVWEEVKNLIPKVEKK